MADNRQSKRTPVTLKIKFKSETLDQFINRYAVDVSHGGIFIRTKDPLPVGTNMRFEFQLKDSSPLIKGEGTVVWTREHDPSRTGVAPGMGVRFERLSEGSDEVLDQILTRKVNKNTSQDFLDTPTRIVPSLAQNLARVSQEQAVDSGGFGDERTDTTPLPTPMPFHSDAADYADEAFEQATKVHSMADLAALTATDDIGAIERAVLGADDDDDGAGDRVGRSRPDSEAETRLVGDPLLPGSMMFPSGNGGADAKSRAETVPFEGHDLELLAATTRDQDAQPQSDGHAGADDDAPTKALVLPADDPARDMVDEPSDEHPLPMPPGGEIGVESLDLTADGALPDDDDADPADDHADDGNPAVARGAVVPVTIVPGDEESPASSRLSAKPVVVSAKEAPAARDGKEPDAARDKAESENSSLPLVLVAVVLLLALGAGAYFMFLRKRDGGDTQAGNTPVTTPDTSVAVVPDKPELPMTIADAAPEAIPDAAPDTEADAGVADAAIENITMNPDAVMVERKLRSDPSGAVAELVGTEQKGSTPMTFKVAEGRTYTVRVTKDGYASQEVTLDPAQPGTVRVTLAPMPMLIRVTSIPEGAYVYVDGRRVHGGTPVTFELPDSFRKKRRFKVAIRHSGFEKLDIMAKAEFRQEGETLVMDVVGTMVEAVAKPAHETKPDEIKPDETKPDETKPDETKPDETKPDLIKPSGADTEAPSGAAN